MSTVLFAWELGGGLGHMMQMVPLARALVGRGHRVFVALRDLSAGETVVAGTDVCYLQARDCGAGVPPAGSTEQARRLHHNQGSRR